MLVMIQSIMSLQLEQYQYEGITVLHLSKYLRGEADAAYLLVIIDQLIAIEKNQILMNLKDITEIDSAGLGVLAEAHFRVEKAGGTIKLVNAAQRHVDLLVLSRLSPLFPSFNSEEAAIKSFASASDEEVKRFDILEFVREATAEEQQHSGADGNAEKQSTPERPAAGER